MTAKANILVVEDSRDMLCFFSDVLREQGYEPHQAENAFAALELMEENTFQAAILDVILPDLNGIDLMKKLRKIDPDLAPIIVTGHGDLESAVEALNDGAEEYLLKPINVPELQAILQKITTRRRTLDQKRHLEQMLRQSEERYRTSVSEMEDAIILVGNVRSDIIDANSKAQKITGHKIQQLLKMTLFDLFPDVEHPELKEILRKIKRRKKDMFSHLSIQRSDKVKVPVEVHGELIKYGEGKLIQFILHDITERKEVEEKKWRAQRFTTFSEMAGLAKDQVSSPLTAILGQTEILRTRLKKAKNVDVIRSLRSIEEQVDKVRSLIDNLQDFAHLQSGKSKTRKRSRIRARSLRPKKLVPESGMRKQNILVVDDEPAMCEVLKDFFTMNSFDVITAGDGEEALKKFSEGHVDLVVTDLTMPKMDGVDLLKAIKKQNASVPVIIMTGLNLNQINDIARKHGADGYIVKPFSFFQMMKLVQEVLTKSSMLSLS